MTLTEPTPDNTAAKTEHSRLLLLRPSLLRAAAVAAAVPAIAMDAAADAGTTADMTKLLAAYTIGERRALPCSPPHVWRPSIYHRGGSWWAGSWAWPTAGGC